MKITTLIDNVSNQRKLLHQHGLSFLIELGGRRILFDFGEDDSFQRNADRLNESLDDVEFAVLSHGHFDHGGGLATFLEINETAPVYIQRKAFGQYYSKLAFMKKYIGLDQSLKNNQRLIKVGGKQVIDEQLTLFSGVSGREFLSPSNASLLVQDENGLRPDPFEHEQYLILTEGENTVLVTGCAHKGIINILEAADKIAGRPITHAIGGFHLMNPVIGKSIDTQLVDEIAYRLSNRSTRYWTCHCTGLNAFGRLLSVLDNQIAYLSTGMTIEI